ncbi:hypothetical protein ACOSP7_006184 [Xanthoceras sorbifolium]
MYKNLKRALNGPFSGFLIFPFKTGCSRSYCCLPAHMASIMRPKMKIDRITNIHYLLSISQFVFTSQGTVRLNMSLKSVLQLHRFCQVLSSISQLKQVLVFLNDS